MADQHPGARPGDHDHEDEPQPPADGGGDGVKNRVSGSSADTVVQGRDFYGPMYFNPPAPAEPERVPVYLPHLVGGLFTGR
ncbi:hypothetical protein ACIBF1_18290 [Spirillospora sp. NPDC050679]